MHSNRVCLWATVLLVSSSLLAVAQQSADVVVPHLVNFSGMLRDGNGKALTGVVGVTFYLYKDHQGGAPLWIETQNVQPDESGHYSVMLGSTTSQGLPPGFFASGEARWLGVQAQGQEEQPRVMLSSVPYAMKAGDAQTVGGLPASAFVLAEPSSVAASGATSSAERVSNASGLALGSITGSGTAGFLPKFTGAATIGNSAVFQSGSSPTAKIGINTSTPTATLDVNGSANVRGNVSATGVVSASAYNIGSNRFAFGSFANFNAFLGFGAGNSTMTGGENVGTGCNALSANVSGSLNTADGCNALEFTVADQNTAVGADSLAENTTGTNNTGVGVATLVQNKTGSDNTGLGFRAGLAVDGSDITFSNNTFIGAHTSPSTGTLTNATAIGANAEVDQSNSLVLGSINGVNGATADTAVGIGTTRPLNTPLGGNPPTKLNIVGNNTFVPLVVQSPSTFGTWMLLNNTSSGGKDWAILSAASGNGERAGNLGITDFGRGGAILLESNVGIGTAAPDNTLTVNGSADKPGGGFWGVFSDRRLKTLNGDFTSGLEQVLNIRPVRYRYKDDNALGIKDREEHIGLVAQEVQRVLPEAVTENSNGYLVVNNEPILWAMLNAIKQQQTLIHKQQRQIANLASQVKIMQASHQASGRELQVRTGMVQTGMTH